MDAYAPGLDAAVAAAKVRRLIVTLGVACFAGSLSARVADPFIATLAREFAAPAERAAMLATCFALPFALVQPLLGPVGDALGKRLIITAGIGLLGLFSLLAALSPSLGMLMVLRALSGAAAGAVMPLTLAAVADAVPVATRQVALSRLLLFSIVGQIAGGSLAGVLAAAIGWRGMLALCGLVAGAAAVILLRFPPSHGPDTRRPFRIDRAFDQYRRILVLPAARLLYAAVFIEGVLLFGAFPWFAPILTQHGLGGTAEAGLTLAAFGIGGITYVGLAPPLLAWLGQGRLVIVGAGTAAAALIGFGVAPFAWAFIACGFALGFGFFSMHNSIQARVTEVAPEARGSAVALHACHFFAGQSLGPVVIGTLIGGVGLVSALSLAALGIALLGLRLGSWRR